MTMHHKNIFCDFQIQKFVAIINVKIKPILNQNKIHILMII